MMPHPRHVWLVILVVILAWAQARTNALFARIIWPLPQELAQEPAPARLELTWIPPLIHADPVTRLVQNAQAPQKPAVRPVLLRFMWNQGDVVVIMIVYALQDNITVTAHILARNALHNVQHAKAIRICVLLAEVGLRFQMELVSVQMPQVAHVLPAIF